MVVVPCDGTDTAETASVSPLGSVSLDSTLKSAALSSFVVTVVIDCRRRRSAAGWREAEHGLGHVDDAAAEVRRVARITRRDRREAEEALDARRQVRGPAELSRTSSNRPGAPASVTPAVEQQGDRPREVGRRHRGSALRRVAIRRADLARPGRDRRDDRVSWRGEIDFRTRARERRQRVALVRERGREDLRIGARIGDRAAIEDVLERDRVAGRGHHQEAGRRRVRDGRLERRRDLVRPEAHVDDVHVVVDGPLERQDQVGDLALPGRAQDLQGVQVDRRATPTTR